MTPLEAIAMAGVEVLDDGEDRMDWLRARQGRITASMISKFRSGGAAARRQVLEESFEEPVEITGNRYIDRGHEREPAIAAWIQQGWPSIEPNVRLFGAAGNRRHAATPDGIGLDPSMNTVLAEIKTSKYDRHPDSAYFEQTGYGDQMQWQMYVCGAVRTLFVWEQHDDDWENGPTPLYDEPRWTWVQRDDAVIEQLIAAADLALAERDAMAAERMGGEEPVDTELETLAAQVLAARAAKAAADANLKAPWTRMLTAMSERPEFSKRAGNALVTWSNRTETTYEPDVDAALAAQAYDDPALAGVTGADLQADLQRAQDVWETHLARFVKPVQKSVQKLTVTAPKVAKKDPDLE